jgi:hypothetical protein
VLVGADVFVGKNVAVNGRTVSVKGSVGYGVAVLPGKDVGLSVRVAGTFGTHNISPGKIVSLVRQLTFLINSSVV